MSSRKSWVSQRNVSLPFRLYFFHNSNAWLALTSHRSYLFYFLRNPIVPLHRLCLLYETPDHTLCSTGCISRSDLDSVDAQETAIKGSSGGVL